MTAEGRAGAPAVRLRRRRRVRFDFASPMLLGLPIAWLFAFLLVPIAIVALYSFDVYSLFPGKHGFTLAAWRAFVHSSVYLGLFWKSVKMSLIVSAVVVALAYPVACYLALSGTKRKYVLLFVLIATVGEFVTPSLVGGTSGYMYGNQIADLFETGFPDWETGSVLALFLLGVVAVFTAVFARFLQVRQVTAR